MGEPQRVHARNACSPCAADLAAFSGWLLDRGYNSHYARRLLFRTKRALEATRFSPEHVWTAKELARVFGRLRPRRSYRHAQLAWGLFLQSSARLTPSVERAPHGHVIDAYAQRLKGIRGLAADTIKNHFWQVRAFLQSTLRSGEAIRALTAERVERYIQHRSRKVSRASLRQTVEVLRSFLRFCFERKLLAKRLDEIDRPMLFRDELLPRALPWPCIQRFLHSIDRRDRTGSRDFMLLHLMAHYGLRPGEITRLKVESINWAERTLTVEQSKTCSWLVLPLSPPTLRLLERFLQSHRDGQSTGLLFQAACAPQRPLTKYSVSQVFRLRARKSGLPLTEASAYSLRHSLCDASVCRRRRHQADRRLDGAWQHLQYRGVPTTPNRGAARGRAARPNRAGRRCRMSAPSRLQRAVARFLAHKRALGHSYRGEAGVLVRLCRFIGRADGGDLHSDCRTTI